MSFKRLLGAVSIVVEEFLTGADGVLGDQDQPGHLFDHHDLGHTVGGQSAVVHQPAIPTRLTGGVDTEIVFILEIFLSLEFCRILPILFSFMLEVIHITALAGIQRIFALQIFRRSDVDELSRILDHKVSLAETFHSLKCKMFPKLLV